MHLGFESQVCPALRLKYFNKRFDIYPPKNLQLCLKIWNLWGKLRLYYHVFPEVWSVLALNKFGKFYHFYNSHLLAGTTQIIFLVGNGISLAHVSVIAKRYNSPMRHEVWPCLHSKYFGKLSHLYHLSIIRLRLWKFGACSSWAELRPHYPISLGFWLPFLPKKFGTFCYFWNPVSSSSNFWK